jgi:hypothetical protein
VELYGGLDTGLETLLKSGYAIGSYTWTDTDPNAPKTASHRVAQLMHQFPHLLPQEAIQDWESRIPMDVRTISLELLSAARFPEGIDLILTSPPMLATQLSNSNREHTPPGLNISRHIVCLVLHLSESQPGGIGYIWNSSELHPPSANTLSLLGLSILLDASKYGLGAYRNIRIWQNLLPHDTLADEHARMKPAARPVEATL